MADEIAKTAETEKAPDAAVDVQGLMAQIESIKKAQSGSDKAYQEAAAKAAALDAEL
jgi:hypothetical protein